MRFGRLECRIFPLDQSLAPPSPPILLKAQHFNVSFFQMGSTASGFMYLLTIKALLHLNTGTQRQGYIFFSFPGATHYG